MRIKLIKTEREHREALKAIKFRKRGLSLEMIRNLHRELRIPAESLLAA